MPRPSPLSASNNAYPHYDTQLTPRTPHSRAGRAEEAFTSVELEQMEFDGDDDYNSVAQQQNAPLLSSSASDSFPHVGYRSRGDDYDETAARNLREKREGLSAEKIIARLPLALYSSVAAVLLVLVFFSLREPETLKKYVGVADTSDAPVSAAGSTPTTVAVDLEAPLDSEPVAAPPPPSGGHAHMPDGVTLVSYENYTSFPLDPIEYRTECIKITEAIMAPHPFWVSHPPRDVPHVDEQPGYAPAPGEAPICSRTITYQLDGWGGLLMDLALIGQVAGLAREREATFFIMDQFWNRGKYGVDAYLLFDGSWAPDGLTILNPFKWVRNLVANPLPLKNMLHAPGPQGTFIINSRTSRYHLGHDFSEHYEDPYGHNLNRLKPMFNFAWETMRTTVRPNAQSAELIKWARDELEEMIANHYENARSLKGVQEDEDTPTMGYIGVHIRRGDRNPQWRLYNSHYIPVSDYVDAAVDSWSRLGLELSVPEDGEDRLVQPVVYIASDSPAMIEEFSASFSPDRVFSLPASKRPELRELASPGEYIQNDFMALEDDVRIRATRGMIVDFALLSGAWAGDGVLIPDATVCAVSSLVCKMAAIALGWKSAFGELDEMGEIGEGNRWVDVDNKGRIVPVWEAFST